MSSNDSDRGHPTRRTGLVILNAALLALLAAVTLGPSADAQDRQRGDYTMVAGGVNGTDSGAVYVVDLSNQEMLAITYDHNSKTLSGIGFRNLAADANSLTSR